MKSAIPPDHLKSLPKMNHFTCQTLRELYVQSLVSNFHGKQLFLEGFFVDLKRNISRQGHYYDAIRDRDTNIEITLRLSEDHKALLEHDCYYEFKGYVNKKQSFQDSKVDIFFHVTQVCEKKIEIQSFNPAEYDLLKVRHQRGFYRIEQDIAAKLFIEEKPKILYITGNGSIVEHDFYSNLISKDLYDITIKKVSFASKTGIIELLKEVQEYDYFAIVRGGGDGLKVFDQEDLCRKILETKVPFITAIGHVTNVTLLEKVADKGYGTPSNFGKVLQELVQQDDAKKYELLQMKEHLVHKDQYYKNILLEKENTHTLETQNLKKRIKKLIWYFIGVVLLASLIIFILFKVQ